jgi:hypothetical protein
MRLKYYNDLIKFLNKQLNWDIYSIQAFIEIEQLNLINNDKDILDILEIFKIYKPSKDIINHLKYDKYYSQSILKKINHEVVNFIFGKNNLKNRKELLTEISLMNPTVDNNKIRAQFITIIEILKGNKEKNSKEFLKIYKKNKEDEILIVFLIKKLNEIQSINIRESQILSLLLLINKSDSKGKIAQIEVGAFSVGGIQNHIQEGTFKKGQEKGYFDLHGSTIVLLLQKDKINILPEILNKTSTGAEYRVKIGDCVAKSSL